jgi:predicted MFS family arabinose efflux permease
LIGAAFGLGFVLGPALGGILSQVDHRAPALFVACVSLVNAWMVFARLPEPRRESAMAAASHGSVASFFSLPRHLQILVATTF